MKLERIHESVLPFVAFVGSLVLAVYSGLLIGNGQYKMLGIIFGGGFGLGALLILRERVWFLIPLFWGLAGKIPLLPVPFSIRQLVVLFALGSFLVLKAFKIVRRKPATGIVDFWLLVMLSYLLTVFVRNPVGVESLGFDRVGGRPYFDIAVAVGAYWVLSRVVATPKEAFMLPIFTVCVSAFEFVLNVVANRFPSTTGVLKMVYSGISVPVVWGDAV